MFKSNYLITGAIMLILLVGAIAFVVFRSGHKDQPLSNTQTLAANTTNPNSTLQGSATNAQSTKASSSAQNNSTTLSYANNGSGTQSSTGQGQTQSQQNQQSLLDTATYGQYDKYKDSTSALFADIKTGDGDSVAAGKKVAVLYKGWLTNGTLFDSNTDGSHPFIFEQGKHNVIAGWEQALEGMKVGGVRFLIIPPSVGYGANGAPPTIPGNSVLIFQVQLVAVQ
jgi:FKBP-type peptidyl-prolyl cis-trans isomerase FkpA